MAHPRIQRNMSLSIDGVGYAGIISEVTLPVVTRITEDQRAGGMDGTRKIDLGQEAMQATLVFDGTNHALLSHMNMLGLGATITLRSHNQAQGSAGVNVTYKLTAAWSVYDLGNLTMGAKNQTTITAEVSHFEIIDAGDEVLYIDVDNMVCRVGGVDQLEAARINIGL